MSREGTWQPNLFYPKNGTRHDHILMRAVDAVNARYRTNTLFFASTGVEQPWQTRTSHRSPRYTTRWRELPCAGNGVKKMN